MVAGPAMANIISDYEQEAGLIDKTDVDTEHREHVSYPRQLQ